MLSLPFSDYMQGRVLRAPSRLSGQCMYVIYNFRGKSVGEYFKKFEGKDGLTTPQKRSLKIQQFVQEKYISK